MVLDPNIVITGDFMLHINNPNDDDATNFKDAMVALGFRQHILFPTHNSGNILDLIFMEEYSNIKVRACRKGNFISAHCLIICTTTLTKPDITHKLVNYRNLKKHQYSAYVCRHQAGLLWKYSPQQSSPSIWHILKISLGQTCSHSM